jgi:acyl carrier protein
VDDVSIKEELSKCFSAVFPQLSPAQIATATLENTSGWDSVAQVTILTLIREKFGVDIDFERFEGADSFSRIVAVLREVID